MSWAPSVFTRALVGWTPNRSGGSDADRFVSLDELYAHVHDEVTRVNPNQTPQKWLFDVRGDLSVARRATPVTVPSNSRPGSRTRSRAWSSWERASAIEPLAAILRGSHPGRALAAKIALERLATEDDSLRVRQGAFEALASVRSRLADNGPSAVAPAAVASVEPAPSQAPRHRRPNERLRRDPVGRISLDDTPRPCAEPLVPRNSASRPTG